MLSPHYQMTYYLLVAARALDAVPRLPRSGAPGGLRWPRELGARARRGAAGPRHRGDPGAAVPAVHPVLAARGRRPQRRLGLCDLFSMPPEEIMTTVLPAVQRRARATTGAATSSSCTPSISGAIVVVLAALGVGDRAPAAHWCRRSAHRAPVPAGRVRRPHAVLLSVVRSDADDEEGARAGHGLLPGGAAGGRVRRRSAPTGCCAGEVTRRALVVPLARARRAGAARRRRRARRRWRPCSPAPEQAARVAANAPALQAGALRLLRGGAGGRRRALGGVARPAARRARPPPRLAVGGGRRPVEHRPAVLRVPRAGRASSIATTRSPAGCGATPKPFRVLDVGVYQGSYLMAHDIQTMLGYHGQGDPVLRRAAGREGAVALCREPERCWTCWASATCCCPRPRRCPGFHQVLGPGDHDAGLAGRPARAGHDCRPTCGSCRRGQAA